MKQASCCGMVWDTFISIFELIYAHIRFLFFKKPIVTIFGGHLLNEKHAQLKKDIHEIAYRLVSCDLMIMTGGGGGIMQEAHQGACRAIKSKGPCSIGIAVQGIDEPRGEVKCIEKLYLTVRTFFVRKWILMRFSKVFFIFPGGFGTLDEFVEIITLLKTNKLDQRKIVLYNKAYWQGFLQWAREQLVQQGFSDGKELNYFVLVDSVEEAVKELKICCGCP